MWCHTYAHAVSSEFGVFVLCVSELMKKNRSGEEKRAHTHVRVSDGRFFGDAAYKTEYIVIGNFRNIVSVSQLNRTQL